MAKHSMKVEQVTVKAAEQAAEQTVAAPVQVSVKGPARYSPRSTTADTSCLVRLSVKGRVYEKHGDTASRYQAMQRCLGTGEPTMKALLTDTPYRKDDLRWDHKRGLVEVKRAEGWCPGGEPGKTCICPVSQ